MLGDAIEYGALVIRTDGVDAQSVALRLPQDRVFEDIAPRLADLDGDGDAEIIVVESQADTGAQLAIYDETGKGCRHSSYRNAQPLACADRRG